MISGRLEGPSSSLESVVVHSGQRPGRQSALAHKSPPHSLSSTPKHILPSQPIKATQDVAQGRPHSPPTTTQLNHQDARSRRHRRRSTSPVVVDLPIPSSQAPAAITVEKVSRSPSPVLIDWPNPPSRPRTPVESVNPPARSDSRPSLVERRSPVIVPKPNPSPEPPRSPAEVPLPPSPQSTSLSFSYSYSRSRSRSRSPSRREARRRRRASRSPSSSRSHRSPSPTRGYSLRSWRDPSPYSYKHSYRARYRRTSRSRRRPSRSPSPDVVIIQPPPRMSTLPSRSRSRSRSPGRRLSREAHQRHMISILPASSRSPRRRRSSSSTRGSLQRAERSPSPGSHRRSHRVRHRRTLRSSPYYTSHSHSPDVVVIQPPPPRTLFSDSPSPPRRHRPRHPRRSTTESYPPPEPPITTIHSYPAYPYPPSDYGSWYPTSVPPVPPPIPVYSGVRFHDSVPKSPPQSIIEHRRSSRSSSPTTSPNTPRIPSRPASVASVIPEPADRIDPRSASFGVNILNIKLGSTETMAAQKISRQKYLIFIFMDLIPRQMYLNMLLRLPYLYFSRVSRIFEDAELTVKEIKDMALDDCTAVQTGYAMPAPIYYQSPAPYGDESDWEGLPPLPSQSFTNLKTSWETFVDSLIKEWKTFNIVSVLLLSYVQATLSAS